MSDSCGSRCLAMNMVSRLLTTSISFFSLMFNTILQFTRCQLFGHYIMFPNNRKSSLTAGTGGRFILIVRRKDCRESQKDVCTFLPNFMYVFSYANFIFVQPILYVILYAKVFRSYSVYIYMRILLIYSPY